MIAVLFAREADPAYTAALVARLRTVAPRIHVLGSGLFACDLAGLVRGARDGAYRLVRVRDENDVVTKPIGLTERTCVERGLLEASCREMSFGTSNVGEHIGDRLAR